MTPDEAREHHLANRIECAETNYKALEGLQALVIHTEWHPYRRPDLRRMKDAMAGNLIFDGRNLWKPEAMVERGLE